MRQQLRNHARRLFPTAAALCIAAPASAFDPASRARLPAPAYKSVDTGTLTIVGDSSGNSLNAQGTGGYWVDRPNGTRIQRLNDRVFIGPDATSWPGNFGQNGVSWAWTMGRGIFSYLPRNAQVVAFNPFGTIGILSGTQTSDSAKLPGEPTSICCGIPFASLLRNDNTARPQDAWNYYATGVKEPGAGNVHNAEFDVLNATGTVVRLGPYKQDSGGITLGISLNAGGEGAPYNAGPVTGGLPPYPNVSASSAALQIFGNGTTFDKGIVIKSGAISPTADGSTVAVDLPAGNVVRWAFDAGDATGAFLNSYISSTATQAGIQFTDSGTTIQNKDGSAIYGKFNYIPNIRNFPLFSGSQAGQPVTLSALGSDANIAFQITAKGTGGVNVAGANLAIFGAAGTCVHTPNSSTETVACFSDERLKRDITDAGAGLGFLDALRVRDFTLKADGSRHTGVIAQEVQTVHPEMVREGPDGMLMVDAPNPWVLVKAIQELRSTQAILTWALAGLAAWSALLTGALVVLMGRRRAI